MNTAGWIIFGTGCLIGALLVEPIANRFNEWWAAAYIVAGGTAVALLALAV